MLVNKGFLLLMFMLNMTLGMMFGSFANIIIAISFILILHLWNNPKKYLRFKKSLKEFSLFNTWVLMRISMKIYRKKSHPWKLNPPTYESWINNSTQLNIEFSYIVTHVLIVFSSLSIFLVLKNYDIL